MGAYFSEDDELVQKIETPVIDDVSYYVEDGTLARERTKLSLGTDPFAKMDYDDLDKNAKRRADRLIKRLEGTGGARSKNVDPETLNGYMLYGLVTPPYNLEYLTELAHNNPTHFACIMAKVVNIVGLGHCWDETSVVKQARQNASDDDNSMKNLARRLSRATDKLDDWLETLNEEDTFDEVIKKAWFDYEATGMGYIEVGRNINGSIGYVGHIPAHTIRVRADRDGFIQLVPGMSRMQLVFFRNFGDRTTPNPLGNDPRPNELIVLKKPTTKNNFYGIPDIIAGMTAIAGDKFAAEYNLEYFENKAVPRYALIIKGAKLSTQAERKILEYFRKEVKGKHHGTLYIPVPASAGGNVDVELTPIENEVQDSSFDKYRAGNRMEIAMVHRVPLSQIGVEGDTNMSSSRESAQVFKDQVCIPEQKKAQKHINKIIKTYTDMFTIKLNSYDLIDEETKNRIHDRYIRTGVLSPNEIRAELGKEPRKGGDTFVDIAALNEAQVGLAEAQAEATLDPPAKPVTPTTGNTGGKTGPQRRSTDGSSSNNGAGTTKTPADNTSRGRASKLEARDKSGKAKQ